MPSVAELEQYIRQAAQARGIDPDIAVKVAKSEGLKPGVWQSNFMKNGVREPSYGPFQLYKGGGLGNEFQKQTGLDPADPGTVNQGIDFALDKAREQGWTPWYGARSAGIPKWAGIGGAPEATQTASAIPAPMTGPLPKAPVASPEAPQTASNLPGIFRQDSIAAKLFPKLAQTTPNPMQGASPMQSLTSNIGSGLGGILSSLGGQPQQNDQAAQQAQAEAANARLQWYLQQQMRNALI